MSLPFKLLALAAIGVAAPLAAQAPVTATAEFVGLDGASHGTLVLTQAPQGVLIKADLANLPEGALAFHFHETGVCEAPFESAGAHFNPADAPHGHFAEGGPHAGDMPNLHVPASGAVAVEVFNPMVSLETTDEGLLLDADGSALVIHAGADDYASQPSGAAGDRIACAVVAP